MHRGRTRIKKRGQSDGRNRRREEREVMKEGRKEAGESTGVCKYGDKHSQTPLALITSWLAEAPAPVPGKTQTHICQELLAAKHQYPEKAAHALQYSRSITLTHVDHL